MERIHTRSTRIFVFKYIYVWLEYWERLPRQTLPALLLSKHTLVFISAPMASSAQRGIDSGQTYPWCCWWSKVFGNAAGKSKHGRPSFDNFDKPAYPLFASHCVDPRLYQFELLEFYPGSYLVAVAYLEKDERVVWSVWGHIFILHQPELSHE